MPPLPSDQPVAVDAARRPLPPAAINTTTIRNPIAGNDAAGNDAAGIGAAGIGATRHVAARIDAAGDAIVGAAIVGAAAGGPGTAAMSMADRPPATGWSPPIDGHGLFKSLMLRLPRRVRRSFDHEQLLALRQAAEEMAWGEHPIDIRFSLPWPGERRYLLLVAGRERRELRPRAGRRRRSPLIRIGNHASLYTLVGLSIGFAMLVGLAAATLFAG